MGPTIAAALLASASPARANWDLAVGVKWLPLNYTQPVSTTGATGGMITPTPLSGWNTTSINNYVGAFILDGRLGFTLGFDFGYSSRSVAPGGMTPSVDLSFTQFGFTLGSKYYLLKPRGGRVAPYVLFDFYKYFASVSTNAVNTAKGSEDWLGGLASPLGIDAAVGVEYFFTNSFSLGAELLGLKYAYSAGSQTTQAGFAGSTTATTTNQYVTFYTGISLNYRFEISGGLHMKVEAEGGGGENVEPPPVRHHNKEIAPERPQVEPPPPPPKEQPPAEPESVD
jgi:hypothetical protein